MQRNLHENRIRYEHAGQRFRNEHTIASSCEVSGRGYWTGQHVSVQIHPAPHGTGVKLVRTDLASSSSSGQSAEHPSCRAVVGNRSNASLRTNLVAGDAKFQMVEHLMAAIAALEIDNCIVEIDGEEFPALDGSCLAFAESLSRAGLIIQASPKNTLVIQERHRVGSPEGWVEALPAERGESYFEYQLGFNDDTPIADQTFSLELTPDRFLREVASARTFVTEVQAEQIRSSGMAAHVTNQELLVIGVHGPIENEFRFEDECARHKTLDLIGDLALSGVDLVGRFISYRGGHSLNGAMAALLAKLAASQQSSTQQSSTQRISTQRKSTQQTDTMTIQSTKMQGFRRSA